MRIVKLGLISFVVLFLIVLGISLLIPGSIRISRAVNITAPKDSIQLYLSDLRQWKQWNGLTTAATVVNPAWSANAFTSEGLQVQLKEVKTDTITTNWKQEGGRETESGFTLHTIDNTTVVQWYFDFKLRWYPWEKFGSIIFDKQLGPPMEESLGALKKKLESIP